MITMMPFSNSKQHTVIVALICSSILTACGGGGGGSTSQQVAAAPTAENTTPATATSVAAPVQSPSAVLAVETTQTLGSSVVILSTGPTITNIKFDTTDAADQTNVAVTFGQVFAMGDVASTDTLIGKLENGTAVQLQVDVKATYPDKSIRHAVISAIVPNLAGGQVTTMNLVKATTRAPSQHVPTPTELVAAGFSAKVALTIDGNLYTASADDLLKTTTPGVWLAGRVANEWIVSAPLRNADGVAHPHLTARFDIRSYYGQNKAKVDVVVENNWTYEPGPRNIAYDAQVTVGGQTVYTKAGLNHYHHARWKKTFWWGAAPQVSIKHNTAYLIGSKAVPNYDQSVVPSQAALNRVRTTFTGAVTEPMQNGLATPYMPQTGGRYDLGLLPGWAVTYLLTMDKDAKAAMMGTADLAGSWSAHFRDKNTDRVVSLVDFPYITILGREGDTFNPVTKKSEALPACGGDCTTPLTADSSHQPNFAYLPYIVSGDHYYLEELQFWAMFNMLQHNPGYRDNVKGLVRPDQTRGQAWSIRTLGDAAFITPDADPLKPQFETFLANNLDWYNTTYTNNATPNNTLGAAIDSNALVYDNGVGIAPWQDDFFTAAVGHVAELGYEKAKPLLQWKSKFPVGRMVASGYCWIDASIYKMIVRDTPTGSNFTTMARVYQASEPGTISSLICGGSTMAIALGLKVGEMVGYADVIDGYPAYMQPALAYSVDAGHVDGKSAWALFLNRPIKPDYSNGAQFAIVPR